MNSTLKNRETEKVKKGTPEGPEGPEFVKINNIKRKELSVPGNKSVHITRISATIKFV